MTVDGVGFAEARRLLEMKERVVTDKVVGMKEAAQLVTDGAHIAIGGCLYSRTPMAALFEILRQGRRDLTLSRSLMCYEGELFMVETACKKIVTSWFGLGLPWGISSILRTFVEDARIEYEEWSHLSLGLRYKAAAMGVPFLPTISMLGSDLFELNGAQEMTSPFTGEKLCAVPACFPDVALIHAHRSDQYGNAQIDGYTHMDQDIARAAQTVILTTEEIVSTEEITLYPDHTAIPHFVVDAVVEVPFGSFPHECYGLYDADLEHFTSYVDRIREKGELGVKEYATQFVHGTSSHEEFLDALGEQCVTDARRRARDLVMP